MKGRRPLPTALKELNGTLEKSRIKPEIQMTAVSGGMLEAPDFFNEYSIRLWNHLIPELQVMGPIAGADIEMIQIFCNEVGIYIDAAYDVRRNGSTNDNGMNPAYKVMQLSNAAALRYGAMIGITQAARQKLIAVAKKPADKMSFLRDGTG